MRVQLTNGKRLDWRRGGGNLEQDSPFPPSYPLPLLMISASLSHQFPSLWATCGQLWYAIVETRCKTRKQLCPCRSVPSNQTESTIHTCFPTTSLAPARAGPQPGKYFVLCCKSAVAPSRPFGHLVGPPCVISAHQLPHLPVFVTTHLCFFLCRSLLPICPCHHRFVPGDRDPGSSVSSCHNHHRAPT